MSGKRIAEKGARDVYILKRNKDQSYNLEIAPPLLLIRVRSGIMV
jgi:hypothetical protein